MFPWLRTHMKTMQHICLICAERPCLMILFMLKYLLTFYESHPQSPTPCVPSNPEPCVSLTSLVILSVKGRAHFLFISASPIFLAWNIWLFLFRGIFLCFFVFFTREESGFVTSVRFPGWVSHLLFTGEVTEIINLQRGKGLFWLKVENSVHSQLVVLLWVHCCSVATAISSPSSWDVKKSGRGTYPLQTVDQAYTHHTPSGLNTNL